MNQLRFNLELPLRLCRALDLAGVLLEGSSVVFVGSNLASRAIPRRVAYAASKAGMEGAVRALAQEWGPRGIRVNCVAPGQTRSAMTEDLPEEVFEGHRQEVPTRRVSLPQDVAELIAFLLSERARQICGQTWRVDGGWA